MFYTRYIGKLNGIEPLLRWRSSKTSTIWPFLESSYSGCLTCFFFYQQ